MLHLIFFLKNLALTIAIVLLLQVKVGHDTLEDKAVFWFRSSALVQPLREVVEGGAVAVRNAMNSIFDSLDVDLFKNVEKRPGQRDVVFQINRSKEFLKEQAVKAKAKAEAAAKKFVEEDLQRSEGSSNSEEPSSSY